MLSRVRFRLPNEVKEAFEAEFGIEERDAVVADLMRQAVEERQSGRRRRAAAIAPAPEAPSS